MCKAGTFSDVDGACKMCPDNTWSQMGTDSCKKCPKNTINSIDRDSCINYCEQSPCKNQGNCVNTIFGATCQCGTRFRFGKLYQFGGILCEEKIPIPFNARRYRNLKLMAMIATMNNGNRELSARREFDQILWALLLNRLERGYFKVV